MTTKRSAEAMWDRLTTALLDAEAAIKEIVAKRAWEPLGYSSFLDAWTARMSGVTLAAELQPHVIYALIDDGATDDDVAGAVKGVGPRAAETVRKQKEAGVPANLARVREHFRRTPPAAPSHIALNVGAENLARFKEIATGAGMTLEEIALRGVLQAFEDVQRAAESGVAA